VVFDLSGKVALVTGAGRGVGVGIARALAAQGSAVAVNDLDADRAAATTAALTAEGATALAVAFDVRDAGEVGEGVASVTSVLGPVDVLVNNAGVPPDMRPRQFRDMDVSEWDRYVDLNLFGSLYCVKATIDSMCERGWGRVVQISSAAGRHGVAMGISLYGAGKSGIEGFIRHLSKEVAPFGVTANCLALGLMRLADPGRASAATQELARQVPVGRLGTPEDVGAAAVYVASEEASWLTGQTIHLNGGSVTV
jgi:NAD(P)-dependent dehydrogenase (short-subunit alcohol dehydrogenase family)